MQRADTAEDENVHLVFERPFTPLTHNHHNSQVDFPVPSDMPCSTAGGVLQDNALPWRETEPAVLISKKHQELKIQHQLSFG